MAKYTGNILTNLGKDLLVRGVIGGEILTFTKVEIGKGIIIEGNQEEFTGLIDSFKVLPITSTAKLEGGSYRVRVAFSNSGIAEDTYLREIGIFARGEDGVEVLYSYCNTDTPDLIPAEGAGALERVEDIITYISNAANVNAVIDQSKVYVTIKDLAEELALKEDKFSKNSGFNREKTDSISLASSVVLATAKSVKTTYDKVIEVLGLTNTNKAAILNNTEQIENLSNLKLIGDFSLTSGQSGSLTENINNFEAIIVMAGELDDLCSTFVPKGLYNSARVFLNGGIDTNGGTNSPANFNYCNFNFPSDTEIKNIAVYFGASGDIITKREDGNTFHSIRQVWGLLKTS